jgi:ATP-binding cassette subfamily B protein RaxB
MNSHVPAPPAQQQERSESLLNFGSRHRLPVILQTEVAECGLACLAMIAGYFGHDTDLVSMRRKFAISSHGVNLKAVMSIATKIHLAPRALRAETDELESAVLPCILHWGLNHFVVLKKITHNNFIIHDPASGERQLSKKEFNNHFTGVLVELTPTTEFKRIDERQTLKLSHFWSRLTGLKRSLVQVIFLSFLLQLFALASPFYMQLVVDDVLLRKDENLLLVLAIGFGLLMLIQLGTSALREFVILYLSNRLGMQMSANLFRHLIRLPLDYFSKRHMGDIVSRFGSLGNVRAMLTNGMVVAIVDGVMALLTLAAMFIYDVRLAFIVLAVVFLYALLRWLMYRPFRLLNEEVITASAKESSHFMESIRAIQTLKLFERENDRQHQWQNKLADVMNKNILIARWGIGYTTINGFLFGIENILIIYFAATAVMGNVISLGMLYAFMSYKARFISSMDSLIAQWIEFKMLDLHFDRLADIAFTETEKNDVPVDYDSTTLQKDAIVGKIEVRNLSYRYSELENYVFKSVNFVIQAGETVAITGPSGCGKTTLMKCLMGLIKPSEGEILIDDKPLKDFQNFRCQIAGVMQEDQLLSGDIAENITCFSSNIDMEKVTLCAQLACIHNDILNMPMQYNTLVGDMGTSLSGGQKQRVILARALYRDPRILFMDEATSNLDVTNESVVNQHIQQLHITRVLVAHRPETVASAGRQINLADHGD